MSAEVEPSRPSFVNHTVKVYTFKRTQFLPITVDTAWEFFGSPKNLGRITPAKMNFKIHDEDKLGRMHEGQQILYSVTVLPLMRVRWLTEIVDVREPHSFVDVQLAGPYKLWRHQHTYHEVAGGIEVTDEIEYALPLGWCGRFIHWAFVAREVNRIFDYRTKSLSEIFPAKS
jgi:ligand-binding SRPBCC domain-containing protein